MFRILKTFLIFFAGFIYWAFCFSPKHDLPLFFISLIILIVLIIFAFKKEVFPEKVSMILESIIKDRIAFTGYIFLFGISTCTAMVPKNTSSTSAQYSPPVVQNESKKINENKSTLAKIVDMKKPIDPERLINYRMFDESTQLKYGKYHWSDARIAPLKVGIYKSNEIKKTLGDAVEKLRGIYPDSDLITIWFYDRKNDYDNGMAYSLGMVDWVPEKSSPGILEPELYDYSNKNKYKYVYSTCKKEGLKIPSEKAYRVNDYFFQAHIKNDSLTDEQLEKMTIKKFKLTSKNFNQLFDEVQIFNMCDSN